MSKAADLEDAFLEEWHRIVAEKDIAALEELLCEEIELGAPPYWAKLKGRPVVVHLLSLIVDTVEDFTYQREWRNAGEYALEFTGRVGETELQGIDLISVDEEGVIRGFDVLMRPVNGVIALREIIAPQMAEFLSRQGQGEG